MAITVIAKKGESVESLYMRFKRKCKADKLFLRIVDKEYYMKPSQKRRNKQKRNQRNSLKGDN